jgi:cytochrome P450
MKADLNVLDVDALNPHPVEIVYDLPAGAKRVIQRADGFVTTIVGRARWSRSAVSTPARDRAGRAERAVTTAAPATTDLTLDDIELGNPDPSYATTSTASSRCSPRPAVGFDREFTPEGLPPGPGFWSLVRHGDMFGVSRDYESFTSVPAVGIFDYPVKTSIINMDPPIHTKYRLIVNRGFTPRMIARLKENISEQADDIVSRSPPAGGRPRHRHRRPPAGPSDRDDARRPVLDQEYVQKQTNAFIAPADPEYGGSVEAMVAASNAIEEYARELGREKQANPTDDVTSAIVNAEVPGENGAPTRIGLDEFAEFVKLLLIGGNETTRNAISHGVRLFSEFPDERARFQSDPRRVRHECGRRDPPLLGTGHAHAPHCDARRRRRRHHGARGREDRDVVPVRQLRRRSVRRPVAVRHRRTPNDHLTFGAGGPHYCLGREPREGRDRGDAEDALRALPDLETTGPAVKMRAVSSNGIKHLPVAWTPRYRVARSSEDPDAPERACQRA